LNIIYDIFTKRHQRPNSKVGSELGNRVVLLLLFFYLWR